MDKTEKVKELIKMIESFVVENELAITAGISDGQTLTKTVSQNLEVESAKVMIKELETFIALKSNSIKELFDFILEKPKHATDAREVFDTIVNMLHNKDIPFALFLEDKQKEETHLHVCDEELSGAAYIDFAWAMVPFMEKHRFKAAISLKKKEMDQAMDEVLIKSAIKE